MEEEINSFESSYYAVLYDCPKNLIRTKKDVRALEESKIKIKLIKSALLLYGMLCNWNIIKCNPTCKNLARGILCGIFELSVITLVCVFILYNMLLFLLICLISVIFISISGMCIICGIGVHHCIGKSYKLLSMRNRSKYDLPVKNEVVMEKITYGSIMSHDTNQKIEEWIINQENCNKKDNYDEVVLGLGTTAISTVLYIILYVLVSACIDMM